MPRETSTRGSGSSKPRAIAAHLAELAGQRPTPRASELTEVGPETNDPKGSGVAVESTLAYPGGPAVVVEPGKLAKHTDDDAHLDVDGELHEPPAPEHEGEGITSDKPPAGKASTDDPRPRGGETLTTGNVEQPHKAAPRKGTSST